MGREKRLVKFTPGDGCPIVSVKIGRNDPCNCGSGKKAKNCCGTKTKFYTTKPFYGKKQGEKVKDELPDQIEDALNSNPEDPGNGIVSILENEPVVVEEPKTTDAI